MRIRPPLTKIPRRAATLGPALLFHLALPAIAQVDQTALNGTVLDPSGRAVPDCAVLATQILTGLERRTISTANGTYSLPGLPAGDYTVVFAEAGFQEVRYDGVQQEVGRTRSINPVLEPSSRTDQVTVSATVAALDESDAAIGATVERLAIRELPLNGRNWATLTALVPGAIDSGGSNQRTIRFMGRGRNDNNFLFDGIDATGIASQEHKPYIRLAIPTGSIQEFRVPTAQGTAEYGDASGGEVIAASAAGGNAFRGSLFEFLRNSAVDARSPFDRTPDPSPFRLNQFGGSLSGPLLKGKTFFFATYEGFRQVQTQTLIGFVPSAPFRAQALETSPVLASLLPSYPAGNGATASANVSQYTGLGRNMDNEDSGMGRVDHRWSDKTTSYVRFNYDRAISTLPLGTLLDRQTTDSMPMNGVVQTLHTFSPTLLTEAKFGVNGITSHMRNLTDQPFTVNVPGFSVLNSAKTSDQAAKTFALLDSVSWLHGRHIVKAGLEIRRVQLNEGNSFDGSLTFSSQPNFANNVLDSATELALLPLKRMRKTLDFAYIQDEIKLRSNITINAGLRYEYYSVFHEATGRALPFDFETCGGPCAPGSEFYYPTRGGLDPRLGIAWTPAAFGDRTVVRSGYGIYHEDAELDDQNFPTANDAARYNLTRGTLFPDLSFPIARFLNNATAVLTPKDLTRRRKDIYAQQWSFSVEQRLGTSFVVSAAYVGSDGTNIMNRSYTNLINPLTGTRPFPAYGQIELRSNNSTSTFHGLQLSLQRNFTKGWLMSANYLWSHAINDASLGSGVEDVFPQNVSCRACDRASSDYDARHSYSAYTVYQFPLGAGRRYGSNPGLLRAVLGGWEFTGVASGRSGLPVNVTVTRPSSNLPDGNATNQRPDLVPGVSLTPPGGSTPQLWINPAAFAVPAKGSWGNLGRNVFRGPALWQIDSGLAKNLHVTERMALEIRGECFNVLNRAQYGNPGADIAAPATFGRITTLVNTGATGSGTPRQFQLALRLQF